MNYIPLFIKNDKKKPILVIGGGTIAAAKVQALESVGATVELLSKKISPSLETFCKNAKFKTHLAAYDVRYLIGKSAVIAATDNHSINQLIAKDCNASGILVNVVDNPSYCDFIFPALVRRGPLQIAISSSGVSPVLARMIKYRIEQAVPTHLYRLIDFLKEKKQILRKALQLQPRRLLNEKIYYGPIAEELYEGNKKTAEELFNRLLHETDGDKQGALYLIGAGPGNPELLTVKASRLIAKADIILYDRLVCPTIIEQYARKEAIKICVGKQKNHHHKTQTEINLLISENLKKNNIVVRLKGGDPGIYAQGAEEIAVAKKLAMPFQIVPGVSAANGCAAYAGIPLTERGGSTSVRFITVYKDSLCDKEFWLSLQYARKETFVFYMSTTHYAMIGRKLIEHQFSEKTPVIIIEQGTTDYHKEHHLTLSKLMQSSIEKTSFRSPSMMIVGNVAHHAFEHGWKNTAPKDQNYFCDLIQYKQDNKINQENHTSYTLD